MPYGASMQSPATPSARGGGIREARRRETRARLFDAALAEISQRGLAAADVSAIVADAGVARGTFYFHFPTKEHVLVEVERAEETRIVSELGRRHRRSGGGAQPTRAARAQRGKTLGPAVFRDMLGLHFCSTRPVEDELAQHPLGQFLVGVIGRAQDAGQVSSDVDAAELATFFLTGLFALLATGAHDGALLSHYVTTIVKGMEKR